ncbi:hypothetical protein M0R45_008603 [Rubus argutus]|uniref:Uncharacterized protein n=1 Tax=Rubus argutus TaxID=59490 RepID=A0AAW1Y235_RUBAR
MDSALCLHYGALHNPSITNRAASIARPAFHPTAIASRHDKRAETPPLVLTKPKDVLASLLKVNENLAKPNTFRWPMTSTKLQLPDEPLRDAADNFKEDLDRFKSRVAYLIRSGKSHKVEKQLRHFIKVKQGIPAYEAEMELVLLLIFQGKYQEALECKCLDDQSPQGSGITTDGRVHLYKRREEEEGDGGDCDLIVLLADWNELNLMVIEIDAVRAVVN